MLNKEEFIARLDIDEDDGVVSGLIDLFESQIASTIGVPVNPVEYTYMEEDFTGRVVQLDMFPAHDDLLLMIDGVLVPSDEMRIDYGAGLIYLEQEYYGFLEAKYSYGLTAEQYETHVKPLITDMLKYHFNHGWDKNASSIKEGEVQVNYDTSVSDGALIQSRLAQLKNLFNVRVAML